MSRAFVFPGQGAQTIGMGRDLAEAYPAARAVFDEVDEALGEKLSALIWEGEQEVLTLTENAQPALMATSMAALAAMRAEGFDLDRAAFVAAASGTLEIHCAQVTPMVTETRCPPTKAQGLERVLVGMANNNTAEAPIEATIKGTSRPLRLSWLIRVTRPMAIRALLAESRMRLLLRSVCTANQRRVEDVARAIVSPVTKL